MQLNISIYLSIYLWRKIRCDEDKTGRLQLSDFRMMDAPGLSVSYSPRAPNLGLWIHVLHLGTCKHHPTCQNSKGVLSAYISSISLQAAKEEKRFVRQYCICIDNILIILIT